MRVLLDARPLQGATGRRGVGAYVRELARGLVAADRGLTVVLLVDSRREAMADPPDGERIERCDASHPPGPDVVWGRIAGPVWTRNARADLLHATFLAPPRAASGVAEVATVHDIIPLDHPRAFGARQRWISRRSLALAARSQRIVAVSRVTAERFEARFPRARGRVVVVPPPVDLEALERAEARAPESVPGPYLLYLGGLDPLKGFEDLLLPALVKLTGELARHAVVVTGPASSAAAHAARRVAESLGIGGRLQFLGHLDDETRASCIAAATAVVVSSHDEGFGLPVVEGLASGVPVAVGPSAAAREAAAGAAALADAATPEALAAAIERAALSGGRDSDAAPGRRLAASRCAPSAVGAKMIDVYGDAIEAARQGAR